MRDSLGAGAFSGGGERSPDKQSGSSLTSALMTSRASKMADMKNMASSTSGGGRTRAAQPHPTAAETRRQRAPAGRISVSPAKGMTKRTRAVNSRINNVKNSVTKTNGNSSRTRSSQRVQRTAPDLSPPTSPLPLRKRGRLTHDERPTRDPPSISTRPSALKSSASRVGADAPKPVSRSGSSSTSGRRRRGTSRTPPVEEGAGASAAAPHSPQPSPFRAPTRQVRSRPIDLERDLRRYVVDDSTGNSRYYRNSVEYKTYMETPEALTQVKGASGREQGGGSTQSATVSRAEGQSGTARGAGDGGSSGYGSGAGVGASLSVGSRRTAGRGGPKRARARGSAVSPSRRAAAAALQPPSVPPPLLTADSKITDGQESKIFVPNYREHNLFGAEENEDGNAAGGEGIGVRGVAGSRRKRPAGVGSVSMDSGGRAIPPPGAPRGGASSVQELETGQFVMSNTCTDNKRVPSRMLRGRAAGSGVASTGEGAGRNVDGISSNMGEKPRILARSWVVRGSDYDADDEDMDFLAKLNTRNGDDNDEEDEKSWLVSTALFEDMLEKLERQDSRARDQKILVESSERLTQELTKSTNRVVSFCDEVDDVLDFSMFGANGDAYKAVENDRAQHKKRGKGCAVSPARKIGDAIQKQINKFDAYLNGEDDSGSNSGAEDATRAPRGRSCTGGDGRSLNRSDSNASVAGTAAGSTTTSSVVEDSALRGPVALNEGTALSLLRKQVVAFHGRGSRNAVGGLCSNSAIYYGNARAPSQEQSRKEATAGEESSHAANDSMVISGRSARDRTSGTVGRTETFAGATATGDGARGGWGARRPALKEGDQGWKGKGKSRVADVPEEAEMDRDQDADCVAEAAKAPQGITDEMLLSIFRYWAAKRQAFGGPMLRCLQTFIMELWERMVDPECEVQDVDEAMDPDAEEESNELIRRCRYELENLRMLADLVKRRERNKKTALTFSDDLFDLVYKAVENLTNHIKNPESRKRKPGSHVKPPLAARQRKLPMSTRGRPTDYTDSGAEDGAGTSAMGVEEQPQVASGRGRRGTGSRGRHGGRAAAHAARLAVQAIASKEADSSSEVSYEYGVAEVRSGESSDDRNNNDRARSRSRNTRASQNRGSSRDLGRLTAGSESAGTGSGSGSSSDSGASTAGSASLSFADNMWKKLEQLPINRFETAVDEECDEGNGRRKGSEMRACGGTQGNAHSRNAHARGGNAPSGRGSGLRADSEFTSGNQGFFVYSGPLNDGLDRTAAAANPYFGGALPTVASPEDVALSGGPEAPVATVISVPEAATSVGGAHANGTVPGEEQGNKHTQHERLQANMRQVARSERDARLAARQQRMRNVSNAPLAVASRNSRRNGSNPDHVSIADGHDNASTGTQGVRPHPASNSSTASCRDPTVATAAAAVPPVRIEHSSNSASFQRSARRRTPSNPDVAGKTEEPCAEGRGRLTSTRAARQGAGTIAATENTRNFHVEQSIRRGQARGGSGSELPSRRNGNEKHPRRSTRVSVAPLTALEEAQVEGEEDADDVGSFVEEPVSASYRKRRVAQRNARARAEGRTLDSQSKLDDGAHGMKRGRKLLEERTSGAASSDVEDPDVVMVGTKDHEAEEPAVHTAVDAVAVKRRRTARGVDSSAPSVANALPLAIPPSGRVSQAAAAVAAAARAAAACFLPSASARNAGGSAAQQSPPSAGTGGSSVDEAEAGSASGGAGNGGGRAADCAGGSRRGANADSSRGKKSKKTASRRAPRALQALR